MQVRSLGWEDSLEEEMATVPPLQYSCLGNPTDRGAWWATAPQGHKESHDWAYTHTVLYYPPDLCKYLSLRLMVSNDDIGFANWDLCKSMRVALPWAITRCKFPRTKKSRSIRGEHHFLLMIWPLFKDQSYQLGTVARSLLQLMMLRSKWCSLQMVDWSPGSLDQYLGS